MPGESGGSTNPPFKKCKHCGQDIAKEPYGATWRWTHVRWVGKYPTAGGGFCRRETKAEPKD